MKAKTLFAYTIFGEIPLKLSETKQEAWQQLISNTLYLPEGMFDLVIDSTKLVRITQA